MPLATVAQALPYVNWILLVALALGSFAYALLADQLTEVSRGYVGSSAFFAAALAGLALLSDFGLPTPTELVIVGAPAEISGLRQLGLAAFLLFALGYIVAVRRQRRALLSGTLALAGGGVAIVAAALGWAPTLADTLPLALQLSVLAAAGGGALATLVLAHWYLVTPRLSERPLVLLTRLLALVIGLQLALFIVWTTLGGGIGQGPFDAFSGGTLFFVALRLIVTLGFAMVLCWMAMRTAQTRSMESATGLLYICLAAVLAGTIGAAALYVSTGLLV